MRRWDALRYFGALWDTYRAVHEGRAGVARRQQGRRRHLVAYARAHSPYYSQLYCYVPELISEIGQLPVVTYGLAAR